MDGPTLSELLRMQCEESEAKIDGLMKALRRMVGGKCPECEGWGEVSHMGEIELKHCPLCGPGQVSLNPPSEIYRYGSINCPGCMLTLPGEIKDQRELIEVWNTRAPSDPKSAVPEPVRDAQGSRGGEPVAYASAEQIAEIVDKNDKFGVDIPLRKTPAGLFQMPLYANPAAQCAPQPSTAMTASAEPVAWRFRDTSNNWLYLESEPTSLTAGRLNEVQPLYASPPPPADTVREALQVAAGMLQGAVLTAQRSRNYADGARYVADLQVIQDALAALSVPAPIEAGWREALERAEKSFEAIRLFLIDKLEEPERSAFWEAVNAREYVRAALAPPRNERLPPQQNTGE